MLNVVQQSGLQVRMASLFSLGLASDFSRMLRSVFSVS